MSKKIKDVGVEVQDKTGRALILPICGDSIRETMSYFGTSYDDALAELVDNAACNAIDEGRIGSAGERLQIVRYT